MINMKFMFEFVVLIILIVIIGLSFLLDPSFLELGLAVIVIAAVVEVILIMAKEMRELD